MNFCYRQALFTFSFFPKIYEAKKMNNTKRSKLFKFYNILQ